MTLFPHALFRPRSLAVALGFGAFLLAAGGASAEPKVLAKIDGVPITEDDVNDALEDIGPGLPQKLDGPARQQYALDYLIDMKLVAKKAAADKMDAGPVFARRPRVLNVPNTIPLLVCEHVRVAVGFVSVAATVSSICELLQVAFVIATVSIA